MTITNSEEEKILRRIPFEILILASIIALASLFFFNPLIALFIFAGGVLSTLSFIWLKQALTKFLLSGKKKALRSALALYGIRLVLILAIFFIIIFFFSKNIIAFVAGFSTMVPVFLAEAVVGLSRMKQWKS
jgi:hypothetical protein